MPDSATVWSCKGGELVAGLPASMGKEVAENGCHPELEVFDYTLKNEWYWKGPPPILLVKGEMNDPVIQRVAGVALKAYQALDCFDCSRIDVRHDVWGPDAIPNVIEVSTALSFLLGKTAYGNQSSSSLIRYLECSRLILAFHALWL